MDTMTNLKGETGRDARRRIRSGGHSLPTSGMAPGFVQGNLAILPAALATDFLRFCQLNPKPCPVLAVGAPWAWDPRATLGERALSARSPRLVLLMLGVQVGFTLLELLVVVVIIGIVAVGAMLSLGVLGRNRPLESERDRLATLLRLVREEASLQGREFGLRAFPGGYEFVAFDPFAQRWQPLTDDRTLRRRQLAPGLQLTLRVEGRPVVLPRADAADRTPQFLAPKYFQQAADDLKCGALATPVGVDWDGDGDIDIICGNTAGYLVFFENLSGPGVEQPKWAAPKLLEADGKVIRFMAGSNGSIQGPAEAKWGYTTLSVADWDGDGLPDLIVNSILGKGVWYRNIGTRKEPVLAPPQPIKVEWQGAQPALAWGWMKPKGKELLTQWRTTPVAVRYSTTLLTISAAISTFRTATASATNTAVIVTRAGSASPCM